MPTELAKAIDDLLDFVESRHEITGEEMPLFRELDERVFVLAFRHGLRDALPRQDELERSLHSPHLRPVMFEGKTNLPGDWDRTPVGFMHVPEVRWKPDMLALRALAEAGSTPEAESGLVRTAASSGVGDDNEWVLASEALPRLRFIHNGYRGLKAFAAQCPDKLRLRPHPHHGRRLQVNAADVLRLEMAYDRQEFEALDGPAADGLSSISEDGLRHLGERVTRERLDKRK